MLKLSRLPTGVPEIFPSIQGEGFSAGMPSVFCRLSLCNLRCSWCDTKHTWDWNNFSPKEQIISTEVDEIFTLIRSHGINNVVLTGGEPLMQQDALSELVALLDESDHRLEIETNGTYIPRPELSVCIDQWNVSPKLSNSGMAIEERQIDDSLRWFAAEENTRFKFVVAEREDLEEVEGIVRKYRIKTDHVMLMPEATTTEKLASRSSWLVEACIQRGYRFGTRLHILLWGDERGK
jgi:7-carboxy-7-deazaguanine synthase